MTTVLACQDPAATRVLPSLPSTSVRLCGNGLGPLVAYRNDSGSWIPVESSSGVYLIPAIDHVTIASVALGPGAPYVEVASLGAAQAESLYPCTFPDERYPVGGYIRGLVYGLAPGDTAYVLYGGSYSSPSVASDPSFYLPLLSGVNDLLAIRYPKGNSAQFDRLIVRRDPAYRAGAKMDLDFGSAEAAAPEPFTLSWDGPPAIVQETLWSPSLGRLPIGANFTTTGPANGLVTSPQTLFTLPSRVQAATDRYEIALSAYPRNLTIYSQRPHDTTLAFGPPANPPTVTAVAASPWLRLRFAVASQPEYAGTVSVTASQPGFALTMIVSKQFLGSTPGTWTVTTPDLDSIPGFPSGLGFTSGSPVWWTVRVASGDRLWFPWRAADGHVIRTAMTFGSWP